MTITELLAGARAAGLAITSDEDGTLRIRGPRAAAPLARALLARKDDVLIELALDALGDLPGGIEIIPDSGPPGAGKCGARGCGYPAASYPHGTWCPRHARMMAPRSQWEQLGVPYPDGQEPPPRPPVPVLTGPVRARLGALDVIYAPCPNGCGRPTCYLPGQAIPPCLGCEVTAHHQQREAAP